MTSERGGLLLEALIAVVVLAVGALALATLQARLYQAAAETRHQLRAVALAEAALERLRAEARAGALPAAGADRARGPDTVYRRRWRTGPGAGSLISVTVAWTDRRGAARAVHLHAPAALP